ncbi:hypothetical protein [Streptomyces sp. NPDC051684]|uniref:hypothetical protein n=1 Tax=Streptomyces sp. NPDC051684 TaxID=3365670 RepID=UPI0037A629BE
MGPLGIRVNCICPGAIDTAMISEETRAGGGAVAHCRSPAPAGPRRCPPTSSPTGAGRPEAYDIRAGVEVGSTPETSNRSLREQSARPTRLHSRGAGGPACAARPDQTRFRRRTLS